jgi:hypothetical protein
VSRTFGESVREALVELMSRDLSGMRPGVMMLDGIELKASTNIAMHWDARLDEALLASKIQFETTDPTNPTTAHTETETPLTSGSGAVRVEQIGSGRLGVESVRWGLISPLSVGNR